MTAAVCVIQCGRDAEFGYMCADHYARLSSILRDIEDETAVLETVPSMAQRSGSGGGTLASHRSPVVLDAVVARDPRRGTGRIAYDDADPWGIDDTASVLETLHSRARTVREEAEIDPPEHVTVSGERDFLSRQMPWIAQRPWIDEMFTEMADLLGQLQRTNKTRPDRPEGICDLPRYESTCGGRIWRREQQRMIWRQADPGSDRCQRVPVKVNDGAAYCDRCHATWDGPELHRLALMLEQQRAEAARPRTEDGRRMLTAEELAKLRGVSVNAVRIRLSRVGARAVHGYYDPDWYGDKATA